MPWMVFVILLTLLDKLSSEVACIRLADIYWNITNPIFRIDNTDHIIDVNKGNVPFEYDQVNIICPVYPHHGTNPEEDENAETYIIYNVSKEEYDSCRITNPNPRIIAVCDKPHQLMYFTITFRSFTPQPGGLEFLPGHDYYFVSTSTGDANGLNQLVGGRCATHNMKVIFKVCCSSDKATSSGSRNQPTVPESSAPASLAPEVTAEIDAFPKSSTSQPVVDDNMNKPYRKMSLYPQPHHPYSLSAPSPRPTVPAGQMGSTTPRWLRRPPLFPSRVTPLTKQELPYDEVPIEDEMARPRENLAGTDQLPNKARSKDEATVSDNKKSSSTSWTCRATLLSDRNVGVLATSLISHLLLVLLWR